MSVTANMGLVLPVPTVTPGPLYASQEVTAFTVIDSHNHTSGQGVPVPSAGLNINGTLTFNGFDGTNFRSTRFSNLSSPLSLPGDLGCLYVVSGNLWYNNGIGGQIQLTVGGALNATSIGGIGGDYSTSTASVFYTSLDTTFSFTQVTGINASIDVGDVLIRNETSGAFAVHLTASGAMSSDYSLTLPVSLPVSQKFMTLDASGNIAAPWQVDGSSIVISSNQLVVPSGVNYSRPFSWQANGTYRLGNGVDNMFIAPYNITVNSVWIFSGTAGTSGTTEYDLKVATTSGGAFATILSTTGKVTSAAASNVWTDSGSVIGAQTGVTKPIVSTTAIAAGSAIRFDLIQAMVAGQNAEIVIWYQQA